MPKPAAKTPSTGDSKVSSPPHAPKLEPTPSPSEPIPDEPAAETSKPDTEMDSEAEDKSPDDAAPPPDADVLAGTPPEHPGCPDCQAKKAKRKGNGFPFGRKPLAEGEVPVTKRAKAEPKTKWGLTQREYKEKYPDERHEVTVQLARVYYVPVHSDGREAPKSLDRICRETYSFLNPKWKDQKDDKAATQEVRSWLQALVTETILAPERARRGTATLLS